MKEKNGGLFMEFYNILRNMKNIFFISLVSLFALNIISCAKDEEHSSTSTTTSDNTTSDNTTSDNTPELFVTWGNSGTILIFLSVYMEKLLKTAAFSKYISIIFN